MPEGGVVFREAIAWLAERLAMPPEEWARLVAELDVAARDRSAGMSDALTRDILEAVQAGLEAGMTAASFRDDFDSLVQAAEKAHAQAARDGGDRILVGDPAPAGGRGGGGAPAR